jgi:toxin YoeB
LDYKSWLEEDHKVIKKINKLIDDIDRNGEARGIGHPEPLKGDKAGWWSREIDKKNRLVYHVVDGRIDISACRSHYGDK